MFDEHVKVTMGLDRQPFDNALKGAKGALGVFKGALGALGVGFSLGAAKQFIESLLGMAEQLKATAETAGVSTDFLQGWTFGAEQSGSSAEKATKALEKFVKGLAETGQEGADVEQAIYKIADQMAATDDPVKRAKIAFDAFGKSAAEVIPLLSGGAEGLRRFRNEATKLSTEDVRALTDAGDAIKSAARDTQVAGGRAVSWALNFGAAFAVALGVMRSFPGAAKALGGLGGTTGAIQTVMQLAAQASNADAEARMKTAEAAAAAAKAQKTLATAYAEAEKSQQDADFDAATAGDQLNVMLAFRKRLLDELAHAPDPSVENAKRLVALAKLQKDIGDKINTVEAERLNITQQQASIFEASANLSAAQAGEKTALKDRSGLTLQDLATMTPMTRAGAHNRALAIQATNAEEYARLARANGMPDRAEQATKFALGIRKQLDPLTTSEADPLAGVKGNTDEMKATLQALLDQSRGSGLNVNVAMGGGADGKK